VADGEANPAGTDDSEGHRRGLSVVAIVGIAVGGASLLSCIGAAAAMTILGHYRRKWADERAREFEAVRLQSWCKCNMYVWQSRSGHVVDQQPVSGSEVSMPVCCVYASRGKASLGVLVLYNMVFERKTASICAQEVSLAMMCFVNSEWDVMSCIFACAASGHVSPLSHVVLWYYDSS
jgi:hypothetical protein